MTTSRRKFLQSTAQTGVAADRRRFHWFERAMGVLKIRLPDVRLLP